MILPTSVFLPLSLMSPLIIFLLLSLLISQYLLIYLILCKLLMPRLCLAQTARTMRYLYESIFLLALFHFVFICRYFVPHVEKILKKLGVDQYFSTSILCFSRREWGSQWKRGLSAHHTIREFSCKSNSCSGIDEANQKFRLFQHST